MKVRIHVAVKANGTWIAVGGKAAEGDAIGPHVSEVASEQLAEIMHSEGAYNEHIVEAEIPDYSAANVVAGEVVG